MSGMSRAQTTRLIGRYTATGQPPARCGQPSTGGTVSRSAMRGPTLLASVDEAHETLSGPATRRILERERDQDVPGRM